VADYKLPDDLSVVSIDELDKLEAEAVSLFDTYAATDLDDLTDEQVVGMETLASAVTAIRAQRDERAVAAAARRDRAAAAALALAKPPDPEPEPEPERPETDVIEPDVVHEPQPVAVAAAATRSVRQVAKREVPLPSPRGNDIVLTAAADVPGFPTGGKVNGLAEVATAFANRSRSFPTAGHTEGLFQRYGVAQIAVQRDHALVAGANAESDYEVIMAAGREANLPGGSLLAAGGWCAPSETFYDLCAGESLDGLIDIPEVTVNRGGIRYTKGPDFSQIYAAAGFCFTEVEIIGGAVKPCFTIPCDTFTDIRLDACGICIKAPILTNVGYPELVQRWISGATVAHQHMISGKVIASMAAKAGTPQVVLGGAGTALDLLTALELAADTKRQVYRLGLNETLEVVLPIFARSIVRSDLALRQGQSSYNVSDADINAAFSARGVRVQWVYNWQEPTLTAGKCLVNIPANVTALIYPAGTFVKGTSDVISLDTVYDTTDLVNNIYTAVFLEEGVLVANRCYSACQVTVPICISGKTGGELAACLNLAAA
jgi:hypothetical protein